MGALPSIPLVSDDHLLFLEFAEIARTRPPAEAKEFVGWSALLGAGLGEGYDPNARFKTDDDLWED